MTADRHASAGERGDRLEALLRLRRPRLQPARQLGVERGDGAVHVRRPVARQLAQEVRVARHQRRLGDDADGVAELGEHLEAAARDLELALDRLVAVGDAGERDQLGLPSRRGERGAQQLAARPPSP